MKLDKLNKEELLDLLIAYDSYIQYANDEQRYSEGFYPVCIEEFYMNDFEYWKVNGGV